MSSSIFGRLAAGTRNLATSATTALDAKVNETTIRLAVTGLSRSGKTVFITSLIHNLIALGHGANTLPKLAALLSEGGQSRLRSVRVIPARTERLTRFDYETKLASLAADAPSWPPRTDALAQISLELELDRHAGISRSLGSRRIRLDILDYPGEWLLDLPMLTQTYAEWSAQVMETLATPPRDACAKKFLDFVATLRTDGPAEDSLLHKGHLLYREAIHACQEQFGLRYLQPGRFLRPGPQGDAPFLWFFPVPPGRDIAKPGSAGVLLAERFEAYKREVREQFFDSHFKNFNRQVLLVDVLGALHGGRAAFEDTQNAIAHLARGLNDGWGFWSHRRRRELAGHIDRGADIAARSAASRSSNPLASAAVGVAGKVLAAVTAPSPIERVAFVATKGDHVPALARDNLEHLLRALVDPAAKSSQEASAQVSFHVAASIRSTEEGTAKLDGQTVEVVRGTVFGEAVVRPFHVGAVPSQIPQPSFWSDRYFEMPVFRPPSIDPSGNHGIPHLGLDDVLVAVIGDLL